MSCMPCRCFPASSFSGKARLKRVHPEVPTDDSSGDKGESSLSRVQQDGSLPSIIVKTSELDEPASGNKDGNSTADVRSIPRDKVEQTLGDDKSGNASFHRQSSSSFLEPPAGGVFVSNLHQSKTRGASTGALNRQHHPGRPGLSNAPTTRLSKIIDDDLMDNHKRTRSAGNTSSRVRLDTVGSHESVRLSAYSFKSIADSLNKTAKDIKRLFRGHEESSQLDVWVGTWNLNGKIPNIEIDEFIAASPLEQKRCHILALGSQECMALNSAKPKTAEWERLLIAKICPMGYKLIKSETLFALTLHVFISTSPYTTTRPLINRIRKSSIASSIRGIGGSAPSKFTVRENSVHSAKLATGIAGIVGNKGAVAVGFMIGSKSFMFVNSHLAAHQEKVAERNANFNRINNEIKMNGFKEDGKTVESPTILSRIGAGNVSDSVATDRYDYVFWFGDLNYRVNGTRAMVERLIENKQTEVLHYNDQLFQEMRKGTVFTGFHESPIDFPPTFKYNIGTNDFDSVKNRIPSWTDRILFKENVTNTPPGKHRDAKGADDDGSFSNHPHGITTVMYKSLHHYKISDHKPVIGHFTIPSI